MLHNLNYCHHVEGGRNPIIRGNDDVTTEYQVSLFSKQSNGAYGSENISNHILKLANLSMACIYNRIVQDYLRCTEMRRATNNPTILRRCRAVSKRSTHF